MAGQQYGGIERYMFADIYNFFLKYKDVDNNDYNWETIVQDAKMIGFKYKEHPLARKILLATMDQLEHIICKKPADGYSRTDWEKRLEIAHKMGW